MTKAQKENRERFKWVQAEAKKLKAKNPRLKHVDAVKQAWAILYSKTGSKPKTKAKVTGVKKSTAKKSVGKIKLTKKEMRLGYTPKPVAKKKTVSRSVNKHQDTKSHNVNIRVISGIDSKFKALKYYKNLIDDLKQHQTQLDALKEIKKTKKTFPQEWMKEALEKSIKFHIKVISNLKKSISEAKKHL